jgi:hypothetical protein
MLLEAYNRRRFSCPFWTLRWLKHWKRGLIAVKLGCDLGLSHMHLEGDSLNVVNALKKTVPCCSNFGHLIDDTHKVAKLVISQLFEEVWVEEYCLSFLWNVILV